MSQGVQRGGMEFAGAAYGILVLLSIVIASIVFVITRRRQFRGVDRAVVSGMSLGVGSVPVAVAVVFIASSHSPRQSVAMDALILCLLLPVFAGLVTFVTYLFVRLFGGAGK